MSPASIANNKSRGLMGLGEAKAFAVANTSKALGVQFALSNGVRLRAAGIHRFNVFLSDRRRKSRLGANHTPELLLGTGRRYEAAVRLHRQVQCCNQAGLKAIA